jgi:cytoskeletal protein RodZ
MMDLGSQFRVRREELGFTIDDVSARTRIPRRLIVDLERNDFGRWPATRVYRVGFLRAYASEVGLNGQQVVAQFVAEMEPPPEMDAAHVPPTAPPARRMRIGAIPLVIAFCLFSALLTGFPRYVRPGDPAISTPRSALASSDIQLESTDTAATSGSSSRPASEAAGEADVEGELRIDSQPAAARVVVNGIARGSTPVRIRYLPAGSYTIRVVRDGYEGKERSVSITAERPIRSISMVLDERAR